MINPVSVWLIDADKHDHPTIRWSLTRSPFPIDLDIFVKAEDALAALQAETIPPRVIITDTKLPGISGIDLLTQVRRSNFAGIPVVIRCTSAHEEDIAAAYAAGANAYVIKAHDLHLIERNISGIAAFFGELPRHITVGDDDAARSETRA